MNQYALGDGANRSLDPLWDGNLSFGGERLITPSALGDRRNRMASGKPPAPNFFKSQPTYVNHRGRFNRAYADGHLETEDFNKPLDDSDTYWRRYNADNQAHRDLLLLKAGRPRNIGSP